ncbi:hypothetical protein [Enhygromyxa salina]|nr:hypothetical protein [Enhygromyxa salina]
MIDARRRSLDSPLFTLAEVREGPERRLLAHVDALILGGPPVAKRLLSPALDDALQPGFVAAAALALLYSDDADAHQALLARLDAALEPALRMHLTWAFGRCTRRGVVARVAEGLDPASALGCLARLEVFVHQQVDLGARLGTLLETQQAQLRPACAWLLRCCTEPGIARSWLPRLLLSEDAETRANAIESGLILGLPEAWEHALAVAERPGPLRARALTWLASLGDAALHRRLIAALANDKQPAALLRALGHCGRVAAIDACLEWLGAPRIGPLVAELMHGIAGLPREQDDGNEPLWRDDDDDDDDMPPLEQDLETDLELHSDELLPLPDPEVVTHWWQTRRAAFDPSARYLLGHPHGPQAFALALCTTSTRRRPALAFELAARSHGQALLDCGALGARQRVQERRAEQVELNWRREHTGGARWR